MFNSIRPWLIASRPKTLTAALVPILVATALAKSQGYSVNLKLSIYALLSSIFIQIGTNFVNDAVDFKRGADTSERLGPKRITVSGMASYTQVMSLAVVMFLIAMGFGLPLVLKGGLPIVLIGIISLFCGYAYTGGPFPLAYRGLGDLFVIIFFGIVAVGGLYFLQTNTFNITALVAGVQVGFLATVLIAINNFRDVEGDIKAKKMTLAARFGKKFARAEILFLVVAAFLLMGFWWYEYRKLSLVLPLFLAPLGFKIVVNVYKNEPSTLYNKFLAQSATLHLVFGLLLSLGFVLV